MGEFVNVNYVNLIRYCTFDIYVQNETIDELVKNAYENWDSLQELDIPVNQSSLQLFQGEQLNYDLNLYLIFFFFFKNLVNYQAYYYLNKGILHNNI